MESEDLLSQASPFLFYVKLVSLQRRVKLPQQDIINHGLIHGSGYLHTMICGTRGDATTLGGECVLFCQLLLF